MQLFTFGERAMSGRVKNILLVEDSPRDVELVLAALAEQNLKEQVDVMRDGAEALDYLFRRGAYANRPAMNPVLVLLDIKMPRVDGLEVLRQIKGDPQLEMVPVVMLTSSHEEKDRLECYRRGANAYVVKPVSFDEFVNAVKEVSLFWAVVNTPPPMLATGT
jgi:CheY-like chemotaxis protein